MSTNSSFDANGMRGAATPLGIAAGAAFNGSGEKTGICRFVRH
jgi:hypothetical protein